MRTCVVVVTGLPGAGKTTFADRLASHVEWVTEVVSADDYYRDLSHVPENQRHHQDFDHPGAIDEHRLLSDISALKEGLPVELSQYDFITSRRAFGRMVFRQPQLIIVEGAFALSLPAIRKLAHVKIFLAVDQQIALVRRIRRDTIARGWTEEEVVWRNDKVVVPRFEQHVHPFRPTCDLDFMVNDHEDLDVAVAAARAMIARSMEGTATASHNRSISQDENGFGAVVVA